MTTLSMRRHLSLAAIALLGGAVAAQGEPLKLGLKVLDKKVDYTKSYGNSQASGRFYAGAGVELKAELQVDLDKGEIRPIGVAKASAKVGADARLFSIRSNLGEIGAELDAQVRQVELDDQKSSKDKSSSKNKKKTERWRAKASAKVYLRLAGKTIAQRKVEWDQSDADLTEEQLKKKYDKKLADRINEKSKKKKQSLFKKSAGPTYALRHPLRAQFWCGPVPLVVRANIGAGASLEKTLGMNLLALRVEPEISANAYGFGWVSGGIGVGCRYGGASAGVRANVKFANTTLAYCMHAGVDTQVLTSPARLQQVVAGIVRGGADRQRALSSLIEVGGEQELSFTPVTLIVKLYARISLWRWKASWSKAIFSWGMKAFRHTTKLL